jgi:hypothetical protein
MATSIFALNKSRKNQIIVRDIKYAECSLQLFVKRQICSAENVAIGSKAPTWWIFN